MRRDFLQRNSRPPSKRDSHPVTLIAKEQGIKVKNPKDYVILIGNRIIDGRRSLTIESGVPSRLEQGVELEYRPPTGAPCVVRVVADYGDTVEVAHAEEGKPNQVVERTRLFVRYVGPSKPRLVHKSHLRRLFGEKLAANFWDHKLRMRVPHRNTKSKRVSNKPPDNDR